MLKNPHFHELVLKQSYEAARSDTIKQTSEYNKTEVAEKISVRGISADLELQEQRNLLLDAISKEKMILDMSEMKMWERPRLEELAVELYIPNVDSYDTNHLALQIAVTIVKNKLEFKIPVRGELVLCNTRRKIYRKKKR